MTLDEWIDRQTPPVPIPLRSHLNAGGPASAEALTGAAVDELRRALELDPRDRAAAFALLAADAYVTYACLWTIREGGTGKDLMAILGRLIEGYS